jgi:hypothetical protein
MGAVRAGPAYIHERLRAKREAGRPKAEVMQARAERERDSAKHQSKGRSQ